MRNSSASLATYLRIVQTEIDAHLARKTEIETHLSALDLEAHALSERIETGVSFHSAQITGRHFSSGQLAFSHGVLRAFGAQLQSVQLKRDAQALALDAVKEALTELAGRKAALQTLSDRRDEAALADMQSQLARQIDELYAARGHNVTHKAGAA